LFIVNIHPSLCIKSHENISTQDLLIGIQGILEPITNSQNTNLRYSFGIENQLKKL